MHIWRFIFKYLFTNLDLKSRPCFNTGDWFRIVDHKQEMSNWDDMLTGTGWVCGNFVVADAPRIPVNIDRCGDSNRNNEYVYIYISQTNEHKSYLGYLMNLELRKRSRLSSKRNGWPQLWSLLTVFTFCCLGFATQGYPFCNRLSSQVVVSKTFPVQ